MNLDNQYEKFRDKEDKIKRTLMHYAAELGFLDVAKTLVKKVSFVPWSEDSRTGRT